jgi:hypothetical protein
MWTKIPFLNVAEAIKPTLVNGHWHKAKLSARYKNVLRKEFLKAGVPWEHGKPLSPNHPFEKVPKRTKHDRKKAERVQRIIKALEKQPDLIAEYRKKRVMAKPLTGFDELIRQTLIHKIKKIK